MSIYFRVVICLSVVWAAIASAKPPVKKPPPSIEKAAVDPGRDEELRHYREGVRLLDKDIANDALGEFETAYRMRPSPETLFGIGLAYKKLLRYPESIAALKRFVDETKGQEQFDEQRYAAESLIAKMRSRLVEIRLEGIPEGATLTVDGRPMGKAPFAGLPLVIGHHVLELSAEGFQPGVLEIAVITGMDPMIRIPLVEIPKNAKVRIDCNVSGATVHVDGKEEGSTPLFLNLLGGGHTLVVSAPGYLPHRGELAVVAGQDRRIEIKLDREPTPAHKKWWVWTLSGVGMAGVVAAGATIGWLADPPRQPSVDGTLSPPAFHFP